MAPKGEGTANVHWAKAVLAGGITGGIEICITYPTEFVKTQCQLNETNPAMKDPKSVIKTTWNTRGFFGFYRGLSALLYFSIPKSAVRFLAFEQARNVLKDENGKMTSGKTLFAGLLAGIAEAVAVVTPMETIKIKLIHDLNRPQPKYKGFVHGVTTITKESGGISGVYKGLLPTILKQGTNQAIRFYVYGELTQLLKGKDQSRRLTPVETALAGALAGAASVFGNTPIGALSSMLLAIR